MIFEQVPVGGDRNFAYVIAGKAGGECAVVDPAYDVLHITALVRRHRLRVKYIVNTHDHYDHTDGNAALKRETGARIVMHASARGDMGVNDGDTLEVDGQALKFIHTPGHTPDSMCVLAGNVLVTGDTLFVGKVGGTGFGADAREEYDSLHQKLMALPDDTRVFPGHDVGVKPSSTIGHEKKTNPFILQKSFEEFLDLKRNWAEYKRKHGIQ
jgi:glyoxylase-like metal-dependent hydrolase (beta-lactamase superfamily II)